MARPVMSAPTTRIRRAAGPSPTLKAEKSRLQARHLGANVTKPWKSDFSPQRGQSPLRAASTTPLPLPGGAGGGVFMFTDSAWTGPPLDPLPRTEGESQRSEERRVGKRVSVSGDLGGHRYHKNKN